MRDECLYRPLRLDLDRLPAERAARGDTTPDQLLSLIDHDGLLRQRNDPDLLAAVVADHRLPRHLSLFGRLAAMRTEGEHGGPFRYLASRTQRKPMCEAELSGSPLPRAPAMYLQQ